MSAKGATEIAKKLTQFLQKARSFKFWRQTDFFSSQNVVVQKYKIYPIKNAQGNSWYAIAYIK